MAINKATLAKKINNVIEYVYPKTSADIVIYDNNYSVASIIDRLISTKVDKENGKGLSTNDFTNDYKNRLDSFDEYAIDSTLSPTSINALENRAIYAGLMEVKNELKEDIANITDEEILQETIEAIREIQDLINNDTSGGIISDINSLKTTVGDSSSGLVKDVNSLKTTVGDSSNGIVKDVTSLKNTVGNSSSGLVKDVASLKTTMGDSSSGVVKDVASLKTTIGDNNSGLVKRANDLESGLGLSSNAANRYGTTAWSRINYLQNNNDYQLNGQIFFSYDLYWLLYRIYSGLNDLNGKIHILAKEYPDTHGTPEYNKGATINFNGISRGGYGDSAIYFHSDYYSDSDREIFAIDPEEGGYYVILIKLNGFN